MTLSTIRNRPRIYDLLHRLHLVCAFSQMSRAELACLAHHARGVRMALEIGTFMGLSAGAIAEAMNPKGTLYCVDPYLGGTTVFSICQRHLRRLGVSDRIVMVRQTSREALAVLPRDMDFVFVDGDHSWEGIRMDWRIVQDCLRVGGIACFHDTGQPLDIRAECVDSIRFFNEVIRRDKTFELVDSCETLNVLRRETIGELLSA